MVGPTCFGFFFGKVIYHSIRPCLEAWCISLLHEDRVSEREEDELIDMHDIPH